MIYEKPKKDLFASKALTGELKPFPDYDRGFGIAFVQSNGFPVMEGFNGLINTLNSYIKYLEQNGVAEWRNDLEYPIGAGVRVGAIWYKAKTRNENKTPANSQNDWELLLNATAITYQDPIYIENNVVKIREATNEIKGIGRFATDEEAQAGASVSAAITPNQAMMSTLGANQAWQNVTADRTGLGRRFKNNTSKPIQVNISAIGELTLYVDNVMVSKSGVNSWTSAGEGDRPYANVSAIIPIGAEYYLGSFTNYLLPSMIWSELR